jgi:hypothetical protein
MTPYMDYAVNYKARKYFKSCFNMAAECLTSRESEISNRSLTVIFFFFKSQVMSVAQQSR